MGGGGLCMSVSGKRPRYVLKRIKNQFSVFEIWSIWPSWYILKRCNWNFFSSDLRKKIVHTFQTILRFFFFNFGEKKIEIFFVHYFVDGSNVLNVLLIFFSSFHPMGGTIWHFGPPLFGYGGGHGRLAPPPYIRLWVFQKILLYSVEFFYVC